jgi:hypothetical protein
MRYHNATSAFWQNDAKGVRYFNTSGMEADFADLADEV